MDANSAYFPCFGESFFLESHTFYVMRIVRTNGWMRMVWRTIRATGCMLLSFLNIDSEDVKRATEILLLIFFPKSGRTYASCTPFSHTMHNGVEKKFMIQSYKYTMERTKLIKQHLVYTYMLEIRDGYIKISRNRT